MGSKISCANCNGKPAPGPVAHTRHHPHYHHQSSTGSGASISNLFNVRNASQILRLWAEVFHVSASSGAVRWNQVSDDLVPITVNLLNGKLHVTAFNSRVEKVLDTYLTTTKLGQASNCFVYWKDNVSGDTWGLNFTSAADAKAFRDSIAAGASVVPQQDGRLPKRAESSYSLRDQATAVQPSKAGSGAHLTTKYYANRTAISTPNSPSKRRLQAEAHAYAQQQQAPQCTCDCLTAEMLHKQRNGRIRYANFTRQDSGGTTQSSRSDGSLVRRQHERQQQFFRTNTRSMEEHSRTRVVPGKILVPAPRRIQQINNHRAVVHPAEINFPPQVVPSGPYIQQQQQKAVVHVSSKPNQESGEPRPQSVNAAAQVSQNQHLVSTATTTDDLPQEGGGIKRSQRPKSLVAIDADSKCRDRTHRSMEGRRRSLERMQCVDLTDASPPTPARNDKEPPSQMQGNEPDKPSAAQLEEYERELRRRLLHGGDSTTNDALETFETLLKESMDDVATLMREVQQELTMIRVEERRYQSQSTQSLHRISSAGFGNSHRSPVWDTLSIDGQLPYLPSFASSLVSASSAYHNAYPSLDRLAGYLTSSEVSDDERASLTTAVSDDEEPTSAKASFKPRNSAVSFECLGSVRKSGFLSVKKWLIRKRHTLELARKRGWKGYWVCLKGTTLLFYTCESATNTTGSSNSGTQNGSVEGGHPSRTGHSSSGELTPKHLIFVDDCLVQAVPEHPRRDNVFCLSTSFGDAYLFDATSLPERDHWISVIHTACAAQIARNSGRCAISHYLIEEYQRLERTVEHDMQNRQDVDLLLSCCSDEKQKQQLVNHVLLLEEKIEKNRIEIFRLRSYIAALTNDEGPNPKTLLSQASRRAKAQLNRIGVFTVSSIHAFNCAKNPQPSEKLHRQSSFGSDYVRDIYSPNGEALFPSDARVTLQILLMTGEQRSIEVSSNWNSEQVLIELFGVAPDTREYFFRCSETGTILFRNDLVGNYANSTLVVTPKILFTIDLLRESNEILFGFSVESELSSNNDLRVYVMRVEPNSIAALHGLCRHDEIMVINGALVQELDMMFVESVLQEELTLSLMIRSSRMEVPPPGQAIAKSDQLTAGLSFDNEKTSSVTDEMIESLVCPPPPSSDFSQLILSDTQLSKYIVPKVDNFLPTTENLPTMNTPIGSSGLFDNINNTTLDKLESDNQLPLLQQDLINSTLDDNIEYTPLAQATPVMNASTTIASSATSSITHMEKLIRELLDTETTYCQSLEQLVKLYLEPLSQNNFLTQTDVKVLFGSILQIIEAQNEFRSELSEVGEHILGDCALFKERCSKATPGQPEPSVNELGVGYIADCFLKHCSNFRNYSTFCASHARAVKLMADEKTALHEWLQQRSSGQISQSLESYLIRPIQRVLKYPLLLGQMKALCSKGTTNYNKLEEALKELEKVAEHINEMQRIHEEYGAIFEHLARNHARTSGNSPGLSIIQNGLVDLSPTALIHYGNVDWINSMEFLGKNCRKGVEFNSICFVFRQFVVFLCKETIRHRKRMPSARSTDVEIIRHQVLIPVIEVQVRACPQSDNETDFKWDLIQLKMNAGKRSEKIYRLSNKCSDARNQFLRTIRMIIREDVRQMNILGFKSPSAGSGSGGGKSRSGKSAGDKSKHAPIKQCSGGKGHQHSTAQEVSTHKVPCGYCGKEVALGQRHKELTNLNWKQRQDSSSTTSH